MSTAARWLTSPLVLFLVVFGVYQLNVVDSTRNDPALTPFSAASLVHDGDLDLSEYPAEVFIERPVVITGSEPGATFTSADAVGVALARGGSGATITDYFPVVPALFAVPAVVVADSIAAVTGGADADTLLVTGRFTPYHLATAALIVALAVLVARSIACRVLTGSESRRRWLATGAALVFAFGTTAWSVASRALWQHAPSLLILMAALWIVVGLDRPGPDAADDDGSVEPPRWWAPALGALLAAAVATRPTNAWFAIALLVWLGVRHRKQFGRAVAGAATVVVAFGLLLLLTGMPFPPPYFAASRIAVGSQTVAALGANWISPNRGLLWSSPIVLLAVPGAVIWWRTPRRRPLVVALGATIGLVTLSVSSFGQWWAGHTFGARFMTEALPALFLLSLPAVDATFRGAPAGDGAPAWLRTRAAAIVVVTLAVWSVGFHALGATTRQTACWNDLPVDVDEQPERVWSITDSQAGRSLGALVAHGPRRMVAGPC
ncbi:MAG: hypothetical protein ACOYML_05000 [Microthrixaceae bacterium]